MVDDFHPNIHDLKTWPLYYRAVRDGTKTFELRRNDREYRVGDLLILKEWEPEGEFYTGYVTVAVVTCIVDNPTFLAPGYVAMGIRALK